MIAVYRRGYGATTDYEIAWVTVALWDLRVRDDAWARMDPAHTGMRTGGCEPTWSGGRSPGTWRRPRPCSPWRPGSPVMARCKLDRSAKGSDSTISRSGRQGPPLPDPDLAHAA